MKEFKASDNFVLQVMEMIHEHENKKITGMSLLKSMLDYRLVRFALASGSVLLAIYNVFTMFLVIFFPVTCG